MICLPLTRTAPLAEERQVERDFTTLATCMKYSSQEGWPFFPKVFGIGSGFRLVIRKSFGSARQLLASYRGPVVVDRDEGHGLKPDAQGVLPDRVAVYVALHLRGPLRVGEPDHPARIEGFLGLCEGVLHLLPGGHEHLHSVGLAPRLRGHRDARREGPESAPVSGRGA